MSGSECDWLLRNRFIRSFLSHHFRQRDYDAAVKLLVIFGAQTALHQFGARFTIADLEQAVASAQRVNTVAQAIPALRCDLEKLQTSLGDVAATALATTAPTPTLAAPTKRVRVAQPAATSHTATQSIASVGTAPEPTLAEPSECADQAVQTPSAPPVPAGRAMQSHVKRRRRRRSVGQPPSSAWRVAGEEPPTWWHEDAQPTPGSVNRSAWRVGGDEYPTWWSDASCTDDDGNSDCEDDRLADEEQPSGSKPQATVAKGTQVARPRPQPVLAVSAARKKAAAPPAVTQDDLVTTKYLDVRSSGYGRAPRATAAVQTDEPVSLPEQQQQQQQQQIKPPRVAVSRGTSTSADAAQETKRRAPPRLAYSKPRAAAAAAATRAVVPRHPQAYQHVQSRIKDSVRASRAYRKALRQSEAVRAGQVADVLASGRGARSMQQSTQVSNALRSEVHVAAADPVLDSVLENPLLAASTSRRGTQPAAESVNTLRMPSLGGDGGGSGGGSGQGRGYKWDFGQIIK